MMAFFMVARPRVELGVEGYEPPVLPLHYLAIYFILINQSLYCSHQTILELRDKTRKPQYR